MDAYPLPCIDEMIDGVRRARFITTLDHNKDYWQVPAWEKHHEKLHLNSILALPIQNDAIQLEGCTGNISEAGGQTL